MRSSAGYCSVNLTNSRLAAAGAKTRSGHSSISRLLAVRDDDQCCVGDSVDLPLTCCFDLMGMSSSEEAEIRRYSLSSRIQEFNAIFQMQFERWIIRHA